MQEADRSIPGNVHPFPYSDCEHLVRPSLSNIYTPHQSLHAPVVYLSLGGPAKDDRDV